MSDERIIEYLRSRASATPPLGAVGMVMAAIPEPPPRHRWTARLLPAVAIVAAAGTLLAVVLTLGGPPDVGVSPSPSTSAEPTPSATVAPSPSPAPGTLVELGSSAEIEARDGDGPWGTITLLRGQDVGGFRMVSNVDLAEDATDARAMFFQNDPDAFYLLLDVTYEADRIPERYGADDWVVRTASGVEARPIERGGLAQDLAPDLPGSNLRRGPSTSTLVVPVPRSAAQEPLTLVYRVGGADAEAIPLRRADEPPAPVASIVPPMPVPEGYVVQPGLPISVLHSPTADDLFSRPDSCTNPEAGYTVTFPDDWWTNTAIGDVPACSWFAPVTFSVTDPAVVPDEVAIVINVYTTGAIGMSGQALPVPAIESINGRSASRSEQVGVGGGFITFGSHSYGYDVWIEGTCCDESELSVIAVARTDWQIEDDPAAYILHKAILDRIMASVAFED